MAVLHVLSRGEKYGYELVEALARQSHGVLAMGQSTLYPLLYNLEAKGLITSRLDDAGPRPRRYYRLRPAGIRALNDAREAVDHIWDGLKWPLVKARSLA